MPTMPRRWPAARAASATKQSIILRDKVREDLGLNRPFHEQYFRWVKGMVLHGDFGTSFVYNKPVGDPALRAFLAHAGDCC